MTEEAARIVGRPGNPRSSGRSSGGNMATLEYFNQIETAMGQAIQALEAAGQDTAELREAQDRIRNLADICNLNRIKRVKAGIDQAWEALDRTSQGEAADGLSPAMDLYYYLMAPDPRQRAAVEEEAHQRSAEEAADRKGLTDG